MNVAQIASPLPGEHLATTSPAMRPETPPDWRHRLNFWAGRALTAEALEIEQEHRAAHLAWQGRIPTAGVVTGLEVALEEPSAPAAPLATAGHFIHLLPGSGLTVFGEDATIPRPLRIALDEIPIRYVRFRPPGGEPPAEPTPADATTSTLLEFGGMRLEVDDFGSGHVPWAAVLVARPAELRAFGKGDPDDPCELDLSRDAFADERRLDATTLWLVQLSVAWENDPRLADRNDPRWRNRLANFVFRAESAGAEHQYIRFLQSRPAGDRWDTVLAESEVFPWELFGVPLALLSSELDAAGNARFFLDRASVTRPGGLARSRSRTAALLATEANDVTLHPPGAGTPALWRARVDQFAEHLGSLKNLVSAEQAARFQFVPPVGLLPPEALDFLTTEDAKSVPSAPGQPPDRAAGSHFFPPSFNVQAVPIPSEDLDAALAASAPLAPFDFTVTERRSEEDPEPDRVRVLVPLPQRLFDPQLLVVELEDPFFAAELARLISVLQDWRQRHDFVSAMRVFWQSKISGKRPAAILAALEPGQLEPEPVESDNQLGFGALYESPIDTAGPWEITAILDPGRVTIPELSTVIFVRLRLDLEHLPSRIEMRWRRGNKEFRHAWTEPSDVQTERLAADGTPLALDLWRLYTVTAAELGATGGILTGFTLHLEDGRVGLIDAGMLAPQERAASVLNAWWTAHDAKVAESITVVGGEWTLVNDARQAGSEARQLAAPFEEDFEPVFADGLSADEHVKEVEDALNPAAATPRANPLSVAADGLASALAELETEANEADDFVDAHFTRAQTNLYRIRKLILGQSAAQKLLINPALATIAEQETASATADQLGAFLTAAKGRVVKMGVVNDILNPPPVTSSPPPGEAAPQPERASVFFLKPSNPVVKPVIGIAKPVIGIKPKFGEPLETITLDPRFDAKIGPIGIRPPVESPPIIVRPPIDDIIGQLPETGPTLPPHGLSIGERFKEPPAGSNLSFARAALNELLDQLPRLRLPLVKQTVRSLSGTDVSLLALQGRAMPETNSANLRKVAIANLLTIAKIAADTDEAEVTLAALDFIEIKAAILRTIERVIQERRALLDRGRDTRGVFEAAAAAAANRLGTIAGPLGEARHDVSVARALRQEEQERVTGINTRRDALIRDEVKFLAYVRPRAVDPVRRDGPGWKLESADTLAPVPACLQRHDQPPDPLRAYVQLFRNAPARWFNDIAPRLRELDTHEKLVELLAATQRSALLFSSEKRVAFTRTDTAVATQSALLSAFSIVEATRVKASVLQLARPELRSWVDYHREVERHSSLGDIIDGRHGHPALARAAANLLEQIEEVATCLHAEFAAVSPALRLAWVERYSQFDRSSPLNDLAALPRYGSLDRAARRRFQAFVDWFFGRVNTAERDAFNLVNDLVRICLLLASHAPVRGLIAGHLLRPVPVRLGTLFPVRAFDPRLVRVGMEVHVWHAEKIVARALVEDLREDGEVSARIERVETSTATLDQTMRVQFVPRALSFTKGLGNA